MILVGLLGPGCGPKGAADSAACVSPTRDVDVVVEPAVAVARAGETITFTVSAVGITEPLMLSVFPYGGGGETGVENLCWNLTLSERSSEVEAACFTPTRALESGEWVSLDFAVSQAYPLEDSEVQNAWHEEVMLVGAED